MEDEEGEGGLPAVPSGFLWGVSTSGYQWEGHDETSQWAAWDASGHTQERNVAAADGLTRYDDDARLAQGMGCNAFRTSIEWARIEPREGEIDAGAVDHYRRLLAALRARGLAPVVTLMHFSYPAWLDQHGGWEDERTAERFAEHARFVARELGDDIRYYLTFNEPNIFLLGGYLSGGMPPGKKYDLIAAERVWANLERGHAEAYRAIHAERPGAQVSLNTYTADYTLALEGAGPIEAIMKRLTSDAELAETALEKVTMDFASFDYYCRLSVGLPFELPRPDRWEVSPGGFYDALRRYHDIYRLPILVAENGMATWDLSPRQDGWTRAAYLAAHVHQLQRAMADGVPVIGYIHWSITDNYEWGSFGPRFGLYSVDCRNQDFTRSPTDGVDAYRAIIAAGGVPSAMLASLLAQR